MKLRFLLFFLSLSSSSFAQTDANEILNLMNEVRTNPSAFLQDRLLPYLKEKPMEENTYVQSLMEELKTRKPAGTLELSPLLSGLSRGHALDMGKKGKIGHESSDGTTFAQRLRKKIKYGLIGENCAYGSETSLEIVMSLLIDDGIENLGHRKNILNPEFRFVGIAIEPHKTYRTNCVMDFSSTL